eukprot:324502-Pelagomonas_calceolata.AAC.1
MRQLARFLSGGSQAWERKGLHSCTCLRGQLSYSEIGAFRSGGQGQKQKTQHSFSSTDTNLANPRTAACQWFMKSLRHGALPGVAEIGAEIECVDLLNPE